MLIWIEIIINSLCIEEINSSCRKDYLVLNFSWCSFEIIFRLLKGRMETTNAAEELYDFQIRHSETMEG